EPSTRAVEATAASPVLGTPAPVTTPAPTPPETPTPRTATPAPPRSARATPAPVPVDLHSTPSGARVTLHGRLLGQTPLSVRRPPGRTLRPVFEAEGRLSIAERVRPRDGLVVTAHLPPAPLVPGLDDLKASPY